MFQVIPTGQSYTTKKSKKMQEKKAKDVLWGAYRLVVSSHTHRSPWEGGK